jgi:hypothetical protein
VINRLVFYFKLHPLNPGMSQILTGIRKCVFKCQENGTICAKLARAIYELE